MYPFLTNAIFFFNFRSDNAYLIFGARCHFVIALIWCNLLSSEHSRSALASIENPFSKIVSLSPKWKTEARTSKSAHYCVSRELIRLELIIHAWRDTNKMPAPLYASIYQFWWASADFLAVIICGLISHRFATLQSELLRVWTYQLRVTGGRMCTPPNNVGSGEWWLHFGTSMVLTIAANIGRQWLHLRFKVWRLEHAVRQLAIFTLIAIYAILHAFDDPSGPWLAWMRDCLLEAPTMRFIEELTAVERPYARITELWRLHAWRVLFHL